MSHNLIKLIRKISDEMASRLGSRLGYVESIHKDEVLKGAKMVVRIIEDEVIVATTVYGVPLSSTDASAECPICRMVHRCPSSTDT